MLYFSTLFSKDMIMVTKLLFLSLFGFALLLMNGCGEEKETHTPVMKCEPGKCGEGKCGDQ